jgi:rfaE bifunctional protein nucleotidyltransferase chain/domain
VNSDAAVRGLKGEGRPVNREDDRALVIAALASVDFVSVFPDVRATNFLAAAQPDIYVKGGDYTLETLNREERRTVEAAGGRIVLIPFVPGKSTTGLLQKLKT